MTKALVLDIATAVARLQQLQDTTPNTVLHDFLLERLLTCDLPRLERHLKELDPNTARLVAALRETYQTSEIGT